MENNEMFVCLIARGREKAVNYGENIKWNIKIKDFFV